MTRIRFSRLLLSNHCLLRYSCRSSTIATITTVGDADSTIKEIPVKSFNEMPGPRGVYNIPYLGMALHFKPFTKYGFLDGLQVFKSLRDKYGDIMRLKIESTDAVLISHPQYAEEVLRLPYKVHKRPYWAIQDAFNIRNNIKEPAIFVLNGEDWVKRRKPAQEKLLKPSLMETYIPIIDNVNNALMEKIGQDSVIRDLLHELINYTAENIVRITVNKSAGCIEEKSEVDFYKTISNLSETFHASFLVPIKPYKYIRTKIYNEFERCLLVIYDFVGKSFDEQITLLKSLEREGKLDGHLENNPTLLHSLLSDPRLTIGEVQSTIVDLFTGSVFSTSNGILFALCDLALHPDKQDILYDEIKRVVGDSDQITADHINQVSYLKSCVKESERLVYPVPLGLERYMESDVIIGGYSIPKGTKVLINNELMCKDERFFQRAEKYLPERWMRNKDSEICVDSKTQPFIFLPFGHGARSCIGRRVAELAMYICIMKIIQKYEVSLPKDVKEIKWKRQLFATPIDKIEMNLKPRKSDG